MMDKVILAGFGGQGVMFIGKVMAYAGMTEGLELCWIPSYGPEMRGGTANCTVLLSDQEIYSPVLEQADCGIVLNQPAYDKFLPRIRPGGTLVVNTSLAQMKKAPLGITQIAVPASQIAKDLGNVGMANMVCLGALLPALQLIRWESLEQAMKKILGSRGQELLEQNLSGIRAGLNLTGVQPAGITR